ncbi:MAG: phenylalanine--tRNA ligase beta subunit-related protein [Methylococcales bacterium]
MLLNVTADLLELGLAASAVVVRGLDNTRISPELIAYRRHAAKRLATHWKNRSISAHSAIREYHHVHASFGVEDEAPAPEKLILYVRRNRDFTSSGALVDCYNIVSAKTLLSIGAHDLAKLKTPVSLRRCTDADLFVPLGQSEAQRVSGEYAYVDPDQRVICRLDVLQCEHSKTTRDSRDVIFFLQGNACLSSSVLLKGTWYLIEMIERFTGGIAEIVDFHDAAASRTVVSSKPRIAFDDFKALDLRKGTILRCEPIPGMPALCSVTVNLDSEVDALIPSANLHAGTFGQKVLVATGLYPVKVASKSYNSYVMTLSTDATSSQLTVESQIPDGKRLY